MSTEHLIKLGKAYAEHTHLRLSTVSTYAANAGSFLGNLESGAGCTLRVYQRTLAWFDMHWPEDLEWPKGIDRPPKTPKSGGA